MVAGMDCWLASGVFASIYVISAQAG